MWISKLKWLFAKYKVEVLAVIVIFLCMISTPYSTLASLKVGDNNVISNEEYVDNNRLKNGYNLYDSENKENMASTSKNQSVSPTKTQDISQTNSENQSGGSEEQQIIEEATTNLSTFTPTPTQIYIQPTSTLTPIPTHIPTPTTQAVNIQIWVRAWAYSTNGSQSAASGNVVIKNGDVVISSGTTDANEVYKVSNMPANSILSIYFYLYNRCGQMKELNTGSNSALYQVDFNFDSSTNCI
jgi:hypothetical protein